MEISDLDNIIELNLYEILDVPNDCSSSKIKKAYKSLIIRVHPDKVNGDAEQFELVNLAYTVLKNEKLRNAYDWKRKNFLSGKDFFQLKTKKKNLNSYMPKNKDDALNHFKILENELNEKHNLNLVDIDYNINLDEKLNKLHNDRINIDNNFKTSFKKINLNSEDFNDVFINSSDKLNESNEIIPRDGNFYSMTNYSSLENDSLYVEDKLSNNKYSSLNSAFIIQMPSNIENKYNNHNILTKEERNDIKTKMNEHNIQMRQFQNIFN